MTKDMELEIIIILPSYANCTREGGLAGCLFEFDKEDNQCMDNREG